MPETKAFIDLRKTEGLLVKECLVHDPLPWRELLIFTKTFRYVLSGGFSTRNVEPDSVEPFDPEPTAEGLVAN